MGIKGLPSLINDVVGKAAVGTYPISKFKNFKVAADISQSIHQSVIAIRNSGQDMVNSKGELTSHLHGIFRKTITFLQNGITPIYVFDGKAPEMKSKTVQERRQKKKEAEESLKNIEDKESEEYIKYFKQTYSPTKEQFKECQILLDLMGVPYIKAPGEADVVCAWLACRQDVNGKRYVKGVCSDDSDMLALGSPYLFKNMTKFIGKNKPITVINLTKTLVKMNLTMDQFVDMCVLLGCDYCDPIKRIGPKTAYKLILKHETLEGIIKHLKKTRPELKTSYDFECLVNARNYFRDALNEIDNSDSFVLTEDNLNLRNYQYDELMDFMCNKHNFEPDKIHRAIKNLEYAYIRLNVTRENTKKVHEIVKLNTKPYILSTEDTIDFLSEDEVEPESPVEVKSFKPTKKMSFVESSDGKRKLKFS